MLNSSTQPDNIKTKHTMNTPGIKPYLHYNPDIERGVLGICILHPHSFSTVYHLLSEGCFHEPAHLAVYKAMHHNWQQGAEVDALSITAQLYTQGVLTLDGVPTAMYVTELAEEKHLASHLPNWCTLLRDLAARRMMLQLTATPYNGTDDISTTAQQLQEGIREALSIRNVNTWINAGTAAQRLEEQVQAAANGKQHGISTTIRMIDDLNGGLQPGHLIVLGARPAVGKSALAATIALQAAKQGHHTALVSMEMTSAEVYARMLAQEKNISYGMIMKSTHNADLLAHLPIFFADDPQLTVHDIRSRAEQLQQSHGLHLLIVDYLQLIQEHADSKRPREQQIAAISRALKVTAMTLNIPVLALSQLNRESEHRHNKRPTLADLRESGAIEQDADAVMLLHRDWQAGIRTTEDGRSTEDQALLMVCKWRNGQTMDITLRFTGHTMRFEDAEPDCY